MIIGYCFLLIFQVFVCEIVLSLRSLSLMISVVAVRDMMIRIVRRFVGRSGIIFGGISGAKVLVSLRKGVNVTVPKLKSS